MGSFVRGVPCVFSVRVAFIPAVPHKPVAAGGHMPAQHRPDGPAPYIIHLHRHISRIIEKQRYLAARTGHRLVKSHGSGSTTLDDPHAVPPLHRYTLICTAGEPQHLRIAIFHRHKPKATHCPRIAYRQGCTLLCHCLALPCFAPACHCFAEPMRCFAMPLPIGALPCPANAATKFLPTQTDPCRCFSTAPTPSVLRNPAHRL